MDGRPVMVIVGAHFLLRCLDLEHFVLYVIKVRYSTVFVHLIPPTVVLSIFFI